MSLILRRDCQVILDNHRLQHTHVDIDYETGRKRLEAQKNKLSTCEI